MEALCPPCQTNSTEFAVVTLEVPTSCQEQVTASITLLVTIGTSLQELASQMGIRQATEFMIGNRIPLGAHIRIWHRQLRLVHQDLRKSWQGDVTLSGPIHFRSGIQLPGPLCPLIHSGTQHLRRIQGVPIHAGFRTVADYPWYALVGQNGTVYTNDLVSKAPEVLARFVAGYEAKDCRQFVAFGLQLLHPSCSLQDFGLPSGLTLYLIQLQEGTSPLTLWQQQDTWPESDPLTQPTRQVPLNVLRWRRDVGRQRATER